MPPQSYAERLATWRAVRKAEPSAFAYKQRDGNTPAGHARSRGKCLMPVTPKAVVDRRRLLLVVGVVSNPGDQYRRDWLRDAFRRFDPPDIAQRYVLGCWMRNTTQVAAEIAQHGDVVITPHADEVSTACIEKSFGWWSMALRLFPRAQHIAKTDDDSLNNFGTLTDILRAPSLAAGPDRMLYGGWPQFSSYLPEYNVGCGWSGEPLGAAHW